jgi:hypothetical protein
MERIKIGLLVDGMSIAAWKWRALELIAKEEGVEFTLVIRGLPHQGERSPLDTMSGRADTFLYSIWRSLDKRIYKVKDDALGRVDLSSALAGIPVIEAAGRRGSCYCFSENDARLIAAHNIDVFLQLGVNTLDGDILKSVPCGVWFYHHGEDVDLRGGPAGMREVLLCSATTAGALKMHVGAARGHKTLYRSWARTDPFSIHRNLNNAHWKAASFAPRKLRELRRIGRDEFLKKNTLTAAVPKGYGDCDDKLNNAVSIKLLTALFVRTLSRLAWKSHSMCQWMLLYRFGESENVPDSLSGFTQLLPPKDRFWADPCAYEYQGRYAIFIEELEFSNNKGYLSVIEFDRNNNPVLPPIKILEKPYHLSYPFVFEDGGTLYMVPETHQNRTIDLYRCRRFPDQWEFVMNLMEDIRAVDTTIWKHEGKYWMFVNVAENPGASTDDELFLYFSDRLLTQDWQPHPCNPIVSDVRCARPAGRIFHHEGNWCRPAQDCSGRYGRAIVLQRIDAIDEHDYAESTIKRIEADWDPDIICTHTLSHMGQLTCIDGQKNRRRF